jgi:OmpA-OmpF porin, OOP family
MTNSLTQKQMGLAVSCALALTFVTGTASAEPFPGESAFNAAHQSYLVDQRGGVVKSGFGLCWNAVTDPAKAYTADCDPAPVARYVEPKPQQIAAVAAPVPVSRRMTLDADALFDFDKAVLRPEGRLALDDFLIKIKDINPETIMAVGHADRFGSDDYNQRLSEKRVESVKAYLVGKGIEPNRMNTEGKGESQPVTKSGECDGTKSAKVIACLQPDRRVEVEVVGTLIAR